MTKLLSIGSIVQLRNGQTKIMIINRYPLYDYKGTIGYFDYSACIYPVGNIDNQFYYFNHEDIGIVCFEGYQDDLEERIQKKFEEELPKISYPRFSLKDIMD